MKLYYSQFRPWYINESCHDMSFINFTDGTCCSISIQEFRSSFGMVKGIVYERKNKELTLLQRYFSVRYFPTIQETYLSTTTNRTYINYEKFKRNNNEGTPSLW